MELEVFGRLAHNKSPVSIWASGIDGLCSLVTEKLAGDRQPVLSDLVSGGCDEQLTARFVPGWRGLGQLAGFCVFALCEQPSWAWKALRVTALPSVHCWSDWVWPLVLIWWAQDEQPRALIRLSALSALTGFLVWMAAGRFTSYLLQSRLYLSFFPALAVLAGAGYAGLSRLNLSGVRLGRVTGFLILLVLGFNTFETGLQTTKQGAAKAILGLSTPDQYLADNLGWFEPAMQALKQLPAGSHVLMLWEARSLYCLPVCEPDEIIDRWTRELHGGGGSDPATPEEIMQSWKEAGYTHLLFYRLGADFIRSQGPKTSANDWLILETTLNQLTLVQDFGDTYLLYRIAP